MYELFGISMPSGNWAQWFSGAASALAVGTALFGYAFNEWRHRSSKKHSEEEYAAGIYITIRSLVNAAGSISHLLSSGHQKFSIDDHIFEIDHTMNGARTEVLSNLTGGQIRLLAAYGFMELAINIKNAVDALNQTHKSLEDYALRVHEFYVCVRRDNPGHVLSSVDRDELTYQYDTKALAGLCHQTRVLLLEEVQANYAAALDTVDRFNSFSDGTFKTKIDLKIDVDRNEVLK